MPFVIVNSKIARSLSRAEFKEVSKSLFFSLGLLGIAAWLFQFYKIAVLNWLAVFRAHLPPSDRGDLTIYEACAPPVKVR
jgi:hypothetical protein